MPEETLKLQVGRTYRAKKPAKAGDTWSPSINDRTITWIGSSEVQYDGPSVAFGKHYPKVSKEKFLAWASRDVTDQLPPNEYAKWPPAKEVQP
ncbi:hypothetical protein K1T36_21005 [Pseudomonas protegens]|uniref:hypothetical protein n=1 Tax=Pseudomonas protegens TaxID=380021 RepID=UPI001C696506|nr:hypothetical protein [Pseudomonas protegens]QYM99546.1 hypothetical protein K1T36_21005 [Pseudomonas protegens]